MKTWQDKTLCVVLLWCMAGSAGYAQTEEHEEIDMAFLEFLGAWEDEDGQWVDPLSLLDDQDGLEVSGDE